MQVSRSRGRTRVGYSSSERTTVNHREGKRPPTTFTSRNSSCKLGDVLVNRIFAGFLAISSTIVLANTGLCKPVFTAAIEYQGLVHDASQELGVDVFNFGDLRKINDPGNNEGIVRDSTFAIVEGAGDQAAVGGADATAGANASARAGHLTVSAIAFATANAVFDNHSFVQVDGSASATATASLFDTITLHSGRAGAPFLIHSFWKVSGATSASASGTTKSDVPLVDALSSTGGFGELSLLGTGLEIADPNNIVAENIEDNFNDDVPRHTIQPLNTEIPITLEGFFGEPQFISLQAFAKAGAGAEFKNITAGGTAHGMADFGHTILWGGDY
jgi:hypothetical protein